MSKNSFVRIENRFALDLRALDLHIRSLIVIPFWNHVAFANLDALQHKVEGIHEK